MIKKLQSKLILVVMVSLATFLSTEKIYSQEVNDSLKREEINFNDKVEGFEERLAAAEDNLEKITKIKLSGYIQAQWLHYENPAIYPNNTFLVRRARIKIKYQPIEEVIFVLQPNFTVTGTVLRDAYVELHDPWIKTFSLWAGQFNRPNFAVEYSSSKREVPERSRVIRQLYPGERGIGVKLEITPPEFPLKVQLAVLNGNTFKVIDDIYGANVNLWAVDFDPFKDLMTRVTYGFKLGGFGKLNIGASGYFGWQKSNSTTLLNSDYTLDKNVGVGESVTRNWFGGEMQLYMDVLGGLEIRAEYLMGINSYSGAVGTFSFEDSQFSLDNDTLTLTSMITNTNEIKPTIRRNFMGGYVYLIKNIGKRNQFAFRWDFYDPNTKLSGKQIGVVGYDANSSDINTNTTIIDGTSPVILFNETTENITDNSLKSGSSDITFHTLTFAWNYFFTKNLRIQVAYEMPINEKVGVDASGNSNLVKKYDVNDMTVYNDYNRVFPQNIFTLRLQAKF